MLTEGENEAGLEAVALTIGDENVKGTEGGVEAFSGSLGGNKRKTNAKVRFRLSAGLLRRWRVDGETHLVCQRVLGGGDGRDLGRSRAERRKRGGEVERGQSAAGK